MPVFAYRGRTRGGQQVAGQIEATTSAAVVAELRRQQIMATSVKSGPKPIQLRIPGFAGKVKDKELAVFTRQIATMIDAGLPLVQCLETLAVQQPKKLFKKTLTEIREDVEGGSTFATSLKRHPSIFSTLYVNMVEAGEAGGFLDTTLNRLAGYIEKAADLKRKIKGALIYPSTIVSVAMAVVIFLLIFVIPTFKTLFEGSGVALPLPTRIVLEISRIVRTRLLLGVGIVVGVLFGLRLYYRTENGKRVIDGLLLRLRARHRLMRSSEGDGQRVVALDQVGTLAVGE